MTIVHQDFIVLFHATVSKLLMLDATVCDLDSCCHRNERAEGACDWWRALHVGRICGQHQRHLEDMVGNHDNRCSCVPFFGFIIRAALPRANMVKWF